MSKTKHVSLPRVVRVDEEVHQYLQEWAERERRSVANLIGIIIEEAVAKDKHRAQGVYEE